MSFCTKCGCECPENAKFCKKCGAALHTAEPYEPFQPDNGYTENSSRKRPKKKAKWWVLVLCVLGAYIIGRLFAGIMTGNLGAALPFGKSSPAKTSSVPFSVGEVSDGYYVNEWANMKFALSDKFPEADESTYASVQDERCKLGYYSVNTEDGSSFFVEFDDVSSFSSTAISDDTVRNTFVNNFKSQFAENTELSASETTKASIGGEDYSHITVSVKVSYFGTDTLFVADKYWRILDKNLINITVSSVNGEKNDFINSISAVK